ncbi:hypothetical protein [Ottowia caeni]|uniref:hypothetical protein n=1 Tax=Ottowia caeni TaxID=2870339 RepID=UPI001E401E04|nr:hypothetical protein [Ottowia caeni]
MLHIVSYSFPPDNVPAAHRPGHLVRYLESIGHPFRLYTRQVKEFEKSQVASPKEDSANKGRWHHILITILHPFMEVDKALPWGVSILPGLWVNLLRDWIRNGKRPDIWATSPGVTNLYIAGIAALFSGSRLHVDLRDAIRGINGKPMPFLTWVTLRYAYSCSVVTDSLALMVEKRATFLKPKVIYNGVSKDAVEAAQAHPPKDRGWIKISYVGAIYGGERPYKSMLSALGAAVEQLDKNWVGIELIFVGRENISSVVNEFQTGSFRIVTRGEVDKNEALSLSAVSDINIVLIGSAEGHRCGIPLKVFDLIGVGRPIFYYGPLDADGCLFLQRSAPEHIYVLDSENSTQMNARKLADWLSKQVGVPTRPVTQPDADTQSKKILHLLSLRSDLDSNRT